MGMCILLLLGGYILGYVHGVLTEIDFQKRYREQRRQDAEQTKA